MKSNQEIQMVSKWRSRALALAFFLGTSGAAIAQNAIQAISSSQQAGSEVLRIELSEALTAVPAGLTYRRRDQLRTSTTALSWSAASAWTLVPLTWAAGAPAPEHPDKRAVVKASPVCSLS